jgi:MFS family permease
LIGTWAVSHIRPLYATNVFRNLFQSPTFLAIFIAGAIATFPLFVPPFFIPLYAKSIGLPSNVGAGLVAGFNFASALGRICCGLLCDRIGAMNVLFLSLVLTGLSNLVIWPFSTTLAPLIPFVILNGMANGGFFSTMPTVIGSVFRPSQVSIAMGMAVTGWAGGYLMVRLSLYFKTSMINILPLGFANRWIPPRCIRWS